MHREVKTGSRGNGDGRGGSKEKKMNIKEKWKMRKRNEIDEIETFMEREQESSFNMQYPVLIA